MPPDLPALTLFSDALSDVIENNKLLTVSEAEKLFNFFKHCTLFKWAGSHNDCEDRANAICILLDEWKVPNYKGWVFDAFFLKKGNGSLRNSWNFHVAVVLPVMDGNEITYYVIDPSSSDKLEKIGNWANNVTTIAFSHYLIKWSDYYIFPAVKIKKDNWHRRNKQNHKWTMQGLAGINGLSSIGKAHLSFNKKRVKRTEKLFKDLKNTRPSFLLQ